MPATDGIPSTPKVFDSCFGWAARRYRVRHTWTGRPCARSRVVSRSAYRPTSVSLGYVLFFTCGIEISFERVEKQDLATVVAFSTLRHVVKHLVLLWLAQLLDFSAFSFSHQTKRYRLDQDNACKAKKRPSHHNTVTRSHSQPDSPCSCP